MRHGLLTLGLVLLSGCAGNEGLPSKNDVIAHTLATTVQVVVERPGGVHRSGSAVLLGTDAAAERTFVLTAHHVVAPEDAQHLTVQFPGGGLSEAEAVLVAGDPNIDLALLVIPRADGTRARLRQEAFLGDEVWVVAFPWGRRRTVVKGVISQLASSVDDTATAPIVGPVRLIDASVSYGMSGGGVFDASTGDLLGIVRGYRTAQLSVQGSDARPLQVPLAGETTVISAAQIACFLTASGFADVVPTGASNATQCRADE
jgi:S1-C subfamily serine protease